MAETSLLNLLADFELVAMLPLILFQAPHFQGANMVATTGHQCNMWLYYMLLSGYFAGTVLPKSYELKKITPKISSGFSNSQI